jgi:DNA-binding response OmpR family regulator
MTALVADESGLRRRMVAASLCRVGITKTVQVGGADHAVAALVEQDFDLIVLEVGGSPPASVNAVREIRGMAQDTPVILVGEELTPRRAVEVKQAGADAFVLRPFEPTTLADKARVLLRPRMLS